MSLLVVNILPQDQLQLTCMKQQVPMTLNLKLLKGPMIDYSPIPDYNEILNYYYTKSQLTKKKKTLYEHIIDYYDYEQQLPKQQRTT